MRRLSGVALLAAGLALTGLGQGIREVPTRYPTIQAAIDAAQPGDTVFIRAGTYRENLRIEKPLQLLGEDRLTVWIESQDPEKPVVEVNLAGGEVEIRGLTVRGGATGFLLRTGTGAGIRVEQVRVVGNTVGVWTRGLGSITVRYSLVVDNEAGILASAADLELVGVEISRGTVGIVLAGTGRTTIQGCLVGFAEYAIDSYTVECGWSGGARAFEGTVRGEGNRVFGLKTDLCPAYPGKPWPKGFVDEVWQQVVGECIADYNQGVGAYKVQDYRGAVEAYERGLARLRNAPFPLLGAYFCQNMGVVYADLGRYEEALGKYAEARAVFEAQGMTVDVAVVDQNVGNVYYALGRYEEALGKYGEARAVFASQEMTVDVATVDVNLGVVYRALGRYEEALGKYGEARAVFSAQGMTVNVAKIDQNVGLVYYALGRYEEALGKYGEARAVFEAQGMTVQVAEIDVNVGVVYYALGRYEEALSSYGAALAALDRVPPLPWMTYSYPATRWVIHTNRGRAYEGLERYEEALAAYREALAVIESIRGFLKTEELKAAWGERTRDVYERLIDLLYRLGQGAQAFPYTERCRARTFLDLLYQGRVEPDQFLGPKEGVVAGVVDPQAIDGAIAESLSLLGPGEAVLSYFVTERGVYLWVITQAGVGEPLFLPYPRAELMRDVLATRLSLERATTATDLNERLEALYERLVAPGLARLPQGVDTLILIPSGPLWYVPFAALGMTDRPPVVQGLQERLPYLVEAYTLAYLPSLASLSSLAQERETPASDPLLGLANPVTVVEGPCAEAERYVNLERAAQTFAERYAQGRAAVYLGAQATEPRAYQPAGHEVVLYACHGVFNPTAPLSSKLLLAPESEAYGPGDRRVPDGSYHAWEVLLTDHTGVELVVLGACETLLPAFRNLQGTLAVLSGEACERVDLTPQQLEAITGGDEVVGLVRAFLSTGARSVLATLWQANPGAVEALLVKVAEHRLGGKSWAQALALAQRELLQGHTFSHPWFWAPYQLIGRWR